MDCNRIENIENIEPNEISTKQVSKLKSYS